MKTEDIKKMAQAWKQVQEASKLDPVNQAELKGTHAQRKDKDIDNDGDVDKSDEYLHNRRKAVKHAMKKEEVEEAYSDAHRAKMAKSYKGKNPHHINAMSSDKGTMTIVTNNGNKYTVTAKETGGKMPKTGDHINKWKPGTVKEEVGQIDELKKSTLGSYIKKASNDMAGTAYALGARDPLKPKASWDKAFKRKAGIAKATDKLTKEETGWTVYERIKESRAAHYKGATKPETMDDKLKGKGAKDMANQPVNTSDIPSTHLTDIQKASAAKKAPARTGDQTKGDKSIVNPVKDTTK